MNAHGVERRTVDTRVGRRTVTARVSERGRDIMNRALWIAQGLTAAVFLMGGGSKLLMPLDEMVEVSGLPGPFILFLGVVELLGAIGLIVPGITRIKTGLTPLAAAGLTI